MKTDLQVIGESSLGNWDKFWKVVQPFRHQLWHYCLKLTGSPWDAEDLLQDTLLKSFASLSALSHREQPLKAKPFLFRVATNHWLDQCRRTKRFPNVELDEEALSEVSVDSLEVNEAILSLMLELTPKQVVVFVLTESFGFSAKEVAKILSSSEGAVEGLLGRARKKLIEMREDKVNGKEPTVKMVPTQTGHAFIEAYNRKDFKRIANMLNDHATYSFVEMTSSEYGKDTIVKYSLNPNKGEKLQNIRVTSQVLFGKQAFIFTKYTENGPALFDVNTIEWENEKISEWKCYYFCRESMAYFADYLNLPLAPVIGF